MRAVQYRTIGGSPEVVEIPTPEPGPGQVRLRVTAAGLCHFDSFVMSLPAEQYSRYSLDQAPEAYRKLHDGTLRGRAVVVPED